MSRSRSSSNGGFANRETPVRMSMNGPEEVRNGASTSSAAPTVLRGVTMSSSSAPSTPRARGPHLSRAQSMAAAKHSDNLITALLSNQTVNHVVLTIVYGVVQSILAIPCLYGFTALVFGNPVYQDFLPRLAKVFLFSSFVHAVAIAYFSPLPYAIGQVQDAGLVFFCRMASDIALLMSDRKPEAVVATTMVTIALSSVLTGLALIGIGKAKLAKLVSYIPMPVIGGYLAFIGLFCVEAGLSLTSHMTISGFGTWIDLILSTQAFILTLPAVGAGIFLCYIARTYSHIAALPMAITILPVLFFVFIWIAGISLEEARHHGWINESTAIADWYSVVEIYDLSAVEWSVVPTQFTVLIGMIIVVVFGSSLDVAAVEMGSGEDLDTDEQLVVIGASNVLSGALGGFTGSYIFTQTLLGFRSKFHTRSVAMFLAAAQFIVFALSIDPLAYTPLFFFAATIIFIGFDLLLEWIVEVRHKLAVGEYIVLLVTFTSMIGCGMDLGFAIGVFCSLVNFVVTYVLYNPHSSAGLVSASIPRSRQLRRPQHELLLRQSKGVIRSVELHGSIFFGSAATVLDEILNACSLKEDATESSGIRYSASRADFAIAAANSVSSASPKTHAFNISSNGKVDDYVSLEEAKPSSAATENTPLMQSTTKSSQSTKDTGALMPVRYLVLDCKAVKNVDATAARRCFYMLRQYAERRDIFVAYACCNPSVRDILSSHGCMQLPWTRHFYSVYDALNWCEATLLSETLTSMKKQKRTSALDPGTSTDGYSNGYQGNVGSNDATGLEEVDSARAVMYEIFSHGSFIATTSDATGGDDWQLRDAGEEDYRLGYDGDESSFEGLNLLSRSDLDELQQFFDVVTLAPGELLFEKDDVPSDCFYIILEGEILTYVREDSAAFSGMNVFSDNGYMRFHPGACLGYSDYILRQPRCFSAQAAFSMDGDTEESSLPTEAQADEIGSAKLARFSRDSMAQLLERNPRVAALIYQLIAKQGSMELQHLLV